MSSLNMMPAIQRITIRSNNEHENSSSIRLEEDGPTEITVGFTLNGLRKLIYPITEEKSTFYIYILLTYNDGGRDFEILSSSEFHFKENHLEHDHLQIFTHLAIPYRRDYIEYEDFVENYYSLYIIYSEKEAEDGSDINFMLNNPGFIMFQTKLNIIKAGN